MEETKIPGTLKTGLSHTGAKYNQGTLFSYCAYLPPSAERTGKKDLALYLLLEHGVRNMSVMLSEFMDEGLIPPGVVIFCNPGTLKPSLPGGCDRNMRAQEYDQYGREHADLLVEEVVPEALAHLQASIDPSPDMHFITGGSSGGMMAWNAVWFRNDFFHRCFLSSPTFSAMRGGEEAMVLLRKTEPRPIRIYLTAGSEEPDYFFGSSKSAAENAASAFEFAGYDFRFEYFSGAGHCCFREDPNLWRRVCAFVWANWKTIPVQPLFSQIRIRKLVADGTTWEKSSEPMPGKQPVVTDQGTYTFSGSEIHVEKDGVRKIAASGFGHVSGIGLSSDRWRLYVTDTDRRFIFALGIKPDGMLGDRYILAPLHLAHDCRVTGAKDMVVLADDRVLTATELGIQGTVSFGLTDLILPLPGDLPADAVEVRGNTLYAASGDTVFRRKLKIGEKTSQEIRMPETPGYSDNFNYTRSHLMQ